MNRTLALNNRLRAVARAAREAGPRFDWVLSGGLALAAFGLYLGARHVFYSYDALGIAEAVERASLRQLLHPHHVLYNPLCRAIFEAARLVGYDGRALGPMHVLSAAAGGAGAAALYLLSRTLGAGRAAALLAGAALATAAGYWTNAASVGVYVPATAAALAALYVTAKVPAGGWKTAALGGGVLATAALFHQINLLLLPAAGIYVLTAGTARGKKTLALVTAFVAVVAIGYVAAPAALKHFRLPAAYLKWFFSYARMNRWGGFSPRDVLAAADGLARAFYVNAWGNNFAAPFVDGDVRHLRVALPLWLAAASGGTNLALWLARGPARRGLLLLGTTFLSYAAFILWWLPNYVGHWLVPAACLLAAVAVAVSTRPRWAGASLVALAVAWGGITNVNWRDGVKPALRLDDNADYCAGIAVGRLVPREALCYLASFGVIANARYFGGLTGADTPNWAVNVCGGSSEEAVVRLEEQLRREFDAGRAVYVGDRAFPGIGGPPLRRLGQRLLRRGRPVVSYEGAEIGETIYVVPPPAAGF